METRRLRYFLEIVDSGSFTRAAKALGVAQPALSQQIVVLEHELKARLLERSRVGVTPTEAGLRLYERARRIVRQVESLGSEISSDVLSGTVSIGLPPSSSSFIGVPLLQRLKALYPLVRPQIVEGSGQWLRDQLERGLLDVAVLPTSLAGAEIEALELFRERVDILSAAGREIDKASPQQLAQLPWIVTRAPNSLRSTLTAWFAQEGLEPNIVAEIDSLPLVIGAVEEDFGVTLLSHAAARSSIASGRIISMVFPRTPPSRVFSACWRSNAPSPITTGTVEILRDVVTSFPALQVH